jgi:hypothetical protein
MVMVGMVKIFGPGKYTDSVLSEINRLWFRLYCLRISKGRK